VGYFNDNFHHVVYRGIDSHLYEMYWTGTGEVRYGPLTNDDTPAAAGDPIAYYTPHNDMHQVVYRGVTGYLYELWWVGITPVASWNVSVNAPRAAGDPAVYYDASTNTKHVIYRGDDGHLHELWWVPGSWPPLHRNLTTNLSAQVLPTSGQLAAYVVAAEGTHHVLYRSDDGHLHELWWWTNRLDVCRTHGFAFGVATESWRGHQPPPHTTNVQTRAQALDVDDFGRVLMFMQENDRALPDDDLCVTTTYAGQLLPDGTIRAFDASYDAAGNLTTLTTTRREDGATRTVTTDYEPFGLAPVRMTTEATGVLWLPVVIEYDPVSLDPLTVRNPHCSPNGTLRGQEFDGFGRVLQTTVTPPDGPRGVLSTVRYLGFSDPYPLGRRIVTTHFSDPVAPNLRSAPTMRARLSLWGHAPTTASGGWHSQPTRTWRARTPGPPMAPLTISNATAGRTASSAARAGSRSPG
jgi:hypothetical protein